MGKFSDNIRKKLSGNYIEPEKEIEFSCGNCLEIFNFTYQDVFLKRTGDIEFVPEPECPRCGAIEELVFSHSGQEEIELMLTLGQIRKEK